MSGGEDERLWVGCYLKHNLDVESLKSLVHDCWERICTVLDGNLERNRWHGNYTKHDTFV